MRFITMILCLSVLGCVPSFESRSCYSDNDCAPAGVCQEGKCFLIASDAAPTNIEPIEAVDGAVHQDSAAPGDARVDDGHVSDASDSGLEVLSDVSVRDAGVPGDARNPDAQVADRGMVSADVGHFSDASLIHDALPPDTEASDAFIPDVGPFCGNAVRETTEQCDDGNANADDGCDRCVRYELMPAGSFMMGAAPGEAGAEPFERPQHMVMITRPFWMGVTEVTQEWFRDVMNFNPANFQQCGSTCPVENVTIDEAIEFVNRLSQRHGLQPCYTGNAANWTRVGPSCRGFRLPTEAEWEYAARGGTTTPFACGSTPAPDLDNCLATSGTPFPDCTVYCGTSQVTYPGCVNTLAPVGGFMCAGPWPVAQKTPNARGLHDMQGNVREWTDTCYTGPYSTGPEVDPVGPPLAPSPGTGCDHVNRDCSWQDSARYCRVASRNWTRWNIGANWRGFRVARTR